MTKQPGFLIKRFVPSQPAVPPVARKRTATAREDPSKCKTDSRFVSVFRQLKSAAAEEEVAEPIASANADWLATLGVKTGAFSESLSLPTAAPQVSTTSLPGLHGRLLPFWRLKLTPEEKAEAREKRSFVKADCKQQRKASQRRLKARMG